MEIFTPAGAASSSSSSTPSTKRSTTMLRLLCPSSRASALRPARDLHVDQPPVGDEAVLTISGRDAPDAAVRAWERVVGHRVGGDEAGGGEEGEREVAGAVGCRMLAAGGQVGCVLGKGGKTVERMRQESGAQIRVFRNREQLPPCAAPGDELIHISGSFPQVRKALLAVSTCLQDNPRPDTSNIPMGRSFGPPGGGTGCPPGIDPHSQRSYLPPHMPDYHTRNYSSNAGAPGPRFFFEQEIVFRMIILNDMVGSIIGKGGSTIRALQSETGASIKIIEPIADSDERAVAISARENSDMMHSPAQDAVLRVHSRISEASVDKSSSAPARLLVPSQHIGCLLGKGGSIIAEMRKVTGASIRIFANEQIPRCAQRNDEMVQVTGSFQSIQDALIHITGRIRDIIIPKPHPSGGMPPYPPVGNIPLHQSRQEPAPPHPSGGMPPYPMHSFRADTPMGPFDTGDHRRPPPHSMEHMGADRMSYSYGCEQGGPQPFLEQPPPRTWAPEAPKTNSEALRNMPDAVPATDFRKGAVASENQVATPTSTTEVVIPCKYVSFVCGTNGSDLEEIKKMSGASITVHDPKPGDTNSTIVICGDPEQTKKAQSLIHAFIFCGLYQT
ncbi:KH domain-containing protein HEN4-like isoform X2 [Phragmites australis]|uniref:KH domain-containing protein HEN4-like isoform X2 n=1 Tax=Phragmites australis TaxID=29695 RepID=UPI002D7684CF|nr:KH domain-containing protein HEN4-like isoform X2 [Phragmites australis]